MGSAILAQPYTLTTWIKIYLLIAFLHQLSKDLSTSKTSVVHKDFIYYKMIQRKKGCLRWPQGELLVSQPTAQIRIPQCRRDSARLMVPSLNLLSSVDLHD